MYQRLCLGSLNTKGILVSEDEVFDHIRDYSKPAYLSVFKYNDNQYEDFKKSGTVSGITDVLSNTLVWDFDSVSDLEAAKKDTQILIKRLLDAKIQKTSIQLYFSGNKGFSVMVEVEADLKPSEVRSVCVDNFGKGLATLDTQIYNASRIIRVPYSRHEKGLYKIPIPLDKFEATSVAQILKKAAMPDAVRQEFEDFQYTEEPFYDDWIVTQEPLRAPAQVIDTQLDYSQKPSWLTNCKYALHNGLFQEGQRSAALLCLGATYKNNVSNNADVVYRMLKGVAELQSKRTGQERFPDNEIYNNIVAQLFSPQWRNGQYTCRETGTFLHDYCKTLGDNQCKHDEETCVSLSTMNSRFTEYATNFENNIIRTGITELDNNLLLAASTINGLLGQPGSGKTATSLQILKNTSMGGTPSIFFSLDMGLPLVYSKLIQKEIGKSTKDVMNLVKAQDPSILLVMKTVHEQYKNVSFCFQSGLDVTKMRQIIKDEQKKMGQPIKLMIVDYLECIAGPYSDSLANTGIIINQLKDLANEMNLCVLILLQTQKHSTSSVSDPLLNLRGVKGSSIIEQACSTMTTLWREGYNPTTVKNDKFISFAVVKNRFGALWTDSFRWDGRTGNITTLTQAEQEQLREFKEQKEADKANSGNGWGWT